MKTLGGGAFFLAFSILACVGQLGAAQTRGSGPGDAAASDDSGPKNALTLQINAHVLGENQPADTSELVHILVERTMKKFLTVVPAEVRPPLLKQGKVTIEFVVHADGKVTDITLAKPSGDVALDRAAWEAITCSVPYAAFARGVNIPEVKLRFTFLYNEPEVGQTSVFQPVFK